MPKSKLTWGNKQWLLVHNNKIVGEIRSMLNKETHYEVIAIDKDGTNRLFYLFSVEIDFPEKTMNILCAWQWAWL